MQQKKTNSLLPNKNSYQLKMQSNGNSLIEDGSPSSKLQRNFVKYSPQAEALRKCLPAGFDQLPKYGQLLIKFDSIVFQPNISMSKTKNLIYRCRMLGYTADQSPFLSKFITYTIHTNNKMFKHYLKDMKICLVQIFDARNYEPLGHSYINWIAYMKSIEDNQPLKEQKRKGNSQEQEIQAKQKIYYLPFLDEECCLQLPVFDFKLQKTLLKVNNNQQQQSDVAMKLKNNPKERIIGRIELRFMSRIYEKPFVVNASQTKIIYNAQKKFPSLLEKNPTQNNIQFSNLQYSKTRLGNRLNISQNISSLKSFSPSHKPIDNYTINDTINEENKIHELKRHKKNSTINNDQKRSQCQSEASRIYSYQQKSDQNNKVSVVKQTKNVDKTKSKPNELELLQLQLDAQDFFQNVKVEKSLQKQETIVEIIKLKTKLQNISHLDVFIIQNNQINSNQNIKNFLQLHFKIYKISADKTKFQQYFKSKFLIERSSQSNIQVHLPNSQGKGTFRCKDLSSVSNEINIYNKGQIVGVLSIRVQFQIKQSSSIPAFSHQTPFIKNEASYTLKDDSNKSQSKNTLCLLVIENFSESFRKGVEEIKEQENYQLVIKDLTFFRETLNASKLTGEYAIASLESIPKVLAVEVKNQAHQFVGMSQNLFFQRSHIKVEKQNLMPLLIVEKNIFIQLKQVPAFKKLPNSISFRLSIFIANPNQLNHFINRWNQKLVKIKSLEAKRDMLSINSRHIFTKPVQKAKQKQYTLSDEMNSENKYQQKIVKTQSQNKKSISISNNDCKSSEIPEQKKLRFNTQVNYTEDLEHSLLVQKKIPNSKEQEEQSSQKENQQYEEQIYLVEFFSKSLNFILSRLGSKKVIEQKISELSSSQYILKVKKSQSSQQIFVENNPNKENLLVSKQQFAKILKLLIGQNQKRNLDILGFDVFQILEALFISENQERVKVHEFTLCLMAYYNFLLLLTKEKLTALKQLVRDEPQVEFKLLRIQQSMKTISSQFLWRDLLPNVSQRIKQKVSKLYRIYPNTPFSIGILLKDLILFDKTVKDSHNEQLFQNLINILTIDEQKKHEAFIQITADLGCLVRETVEEIITLQSFKKEDTLEHETWISKALTLVDQFGNKENFGSIEANGRNEFYFNLNHFQDCFSKMGIQTSLWQSLMLIEQIKVWHQGDDIREKNEFETGEGIISSRLIKSWLNSLNIKIQIKNQQKITQNLINSKHSKSDNGKEGSDDEKKFQRKNNYGNNDKQQVSKERIKKLEKNIGEVTMQKENQKKVLNNVFQNESIFSQNIDLNKAHKNSLKGSQTMNNQSDVVNIANLLRQNQNNLYFLPSVSRSNAIDKIQSNPLNQNILHGLDDYSKRNHDKFLLNKKQKINTDEVSKSRHDSKSSSLAESQQSSLIVGLSKKQPHPCYLSIKLCQIKVKRNQIILNKQGLKKLTISLKKKLSENSLSTQKEFESNQKQHYFMTSQTVEELVNSHDQLIGQKYALNNFKIDVSNAHNFSVFFNQGLKLQLLNLSEPILTKNSEKYYSRCQQLILSGILPIEDIMNIIEGYKSKINQNNQSSENFQIHKKKTIVLYSGKEIVGKSMIEIILSQKPLLIMNKNDDLAKNKTIIQLMVTKKELFKPKNSSKNSILNNQTQLALYYYPLKNQQQLIQLLPIFDENTWQKISLPEPILEYQLLLKSIQISKVVEKSQNLDRSSSIYNTDGLTAFQTLSNIPVSIIDCKHKCIIPLQTLYFKKVLTQQYPLINQQNGKFVANIFAQLRIIGLQKACINSLLKQTS